jgi:phosphoribosyl-ATP pyrophosphohydrolase
MRKQDSLDFIEELFSTIRNRAKSKKKNSYTNLLLKKGKNKIAQKIGEESTELIIDYLNGSKKRTVEEASDLIYHLLVLLYSKKISIKDIKKELTKRKNVRR